MAKKHSHLITLQNWHYTLLDMLLTFVMCRFYSQILIKMNTQEQKSEVSKMVKIEPRYLMGTKAYHQLGDISRGEYDLFSATGETENYWVGMWTTGFGFFNVLFPKETSRELTKDEIKKYNKTYVQINSQPPVKLNVS